MEIIEKYNLFLEIDKSFSDNTISTYLYTINIFIKFLDKNNINLFETEYNDLLNFLNFLKITLKYKSKTINTYIASLKSFFNFLYKENYIKYNPALLLDSPKIEKKLPTFLTDDELSMIFNVININSKLGKRDYLILKILFDTGVRVSELININVNNIDFENKIIKILGKGNKERIVCFHESTKNELIDHLNNRPFNTCLFINNKGDKLSRGDIYHLIKKYAKDAGIQKNVTPHVIRHTFATHMIQNDADILIVKTILGHEKLSTTQLYTHLTKKDLKKKYDAIKERGN